MGGPFVVFIQEIIVMILSLMEKPPTHTGGTHFAYQNHVF